MTYSGEREPAPLATKDGPWIVSYLVAVLLAGALWELAFWLWSAWFALAASLVLVGLFVFEHSRRRVVSLLAMALMAVVWALTWAQWIILDAKR